MKKWIVLLVALLTTGCGASTVASPRYVPGEDPTFTAGCVYTIAADGSLTLNCTPDATTPTSSPTQSPTSSPTASPTPPPTTSPTSSPSSPSSSLKAEETGLEVTKVSAAKDQGVALEVPWKTLEPSQGTFDFAPIDDALANPNVTFIKLRIMAGFESPTWLPGGLHYISTKNGNGDVPLYWTQPVIDAWGGLVNALAAKYDSNPKFLTVTNSLCMTTYAEPFIKGGSTAGADLYKLGDNYAGELACMQGAMSDLTSAFHETRISTALHDAWQEPVQGGITTSWPDEHNLIQEWRAEYGAQVEYQDNGLSLQKATCSQTSPTPSDAANQWCYLKAITPPKGAQQGCGPTACSSQQTDVVDPALKYGLCFIEHASWSGLTASQISSDDAALAADCS